MNTPCKTIIDTKSVAVNHHLCSFVKWIRELNDLYVVKEPSLFLVLKALSSTTNIDYDVERFKKTINNMPRLIWMIEYCRICLSMFSNIKHLVKILSAVENLDINATAPLGDTVVAFAAYYNDTDFIYLLSRRLTTKPDLNKCNKIGMPPLIMCAFIELEDETIISDNTLKCLVACGADPCFRLDSVMTIAHILARNDVYVGVMECLLSMKNVEFNLSDMFKTIYKGVGTPMDVAICFNAVKQMQVMLDHDMTWLGFQETFRDLVIMRDMFPSEEAYYNTCLMCLLKNPTIQLSMDVLIGSVLFPRCEILNLFIRLGANYHFLPKDVFSRFDYKQKQIMATYGIDLGVTITNAAALTSGCTVCAWCRQNANYECGRCGLVMYCSQNCQAEDWSFHKDVCNQKKKSDKRRMEKLMEGE